MLSNWTGHLPFGMWLVGAMKPRLLVELGVYFGTSYCGFCQAIKAGKIETRCWGIDTWESDPHTEPYDPGVINKLSAHHDPLYGSFSTLWRMTFDEARPLFLDGSIDLLHIDGYHTYGAVRHDFESWLPKLSDRAVVLFHDTRERGKGFGVWRLWRDVIRAYPSFEFTHEHGLGVLAVGTDPAARRIIAQLCDRPDVTRTVFESLGRQLIPSS